MDRAGLLRHAVSLLANRPHSTHELTAKLARVTARQHARAARQAAEAAAGGGDDERVRLLGRAACLRAGACVRRSSGRPCARAV
jgi:hypothetical protein